jgi:hypothetical protein
MSPFDFDEVVEQYHLALDEYVKGNLEPVMMMCSHQEDVTLANPPVHLCVGGSRLLLRRSVPHRRSEMARALASRS